MPRCKFLFTCELGDPISSIFINDYGCMAGTYMGKVWVFEFESKQVELLASFSDEGVRGLYLDGDAAFATFSESCHSWSRTMSSPYAYVNSSRKFQFKQLSNAKTYQQTKHVLQRDALACALLTNVSTVVNVTNQESHHSNFKICDHSVTPEVVPCDFDGSNLAVVDWSKASPVFHVIHVVRNEECEVTDLPKGRRVTLARLWGPDCLIYVTGETATYIYDFRLHKLRSKLHGHRAEIVAMDAHDEELISTLSLDAEVRVWRGNTGECIHSLFVQEASFLLGYPYFINVCRNRVLVSADEGVYLIEHDHDIGGDDKA